MRNLLCILALAICACVAAWWVTYPATADVPQPLAKSTPDATPATMPATMPDAQGQKVSPSDAAMEPIPEPVTLLILGGGLTMTLFFAGRKRLRKRADS